uniref:Uncharacterized protein n=1 Tax=Zea mays TaxID=4577 RepID=C4J3M9_MAIZE|nr:unknown [Zea mays]
MPGGVSVSSVESPEVCGGSNVELRRRPWRQLLAVTRLQLRVRRRHGRRLRLGELLQLPDYHVSQLTAGAPVLGRHIKTTIREEEKESRFFFVWFHLTMALVAGQQPKQHRTFGDGGARSGWRP